MASDRDRIDTAIRQDEDGEYFVELMIDVPTSLRPPAWANGNAGTTSGLRLHLSRDDAIELASMLLARSAGARRLTRRDEDANEDANDS